MNAYYGFILSLFLATVLVPYLTRYATRLGLMDEPDERKIHQNSIPRVGGIAIAFSSLLSIAVWLPVKGTVAGYLLGALIIVLFGVADDRYNLDYRLKFAGQLLGGLAFVIVSGIYLTRLPFAYDSLMPAWLGVPLTLILIVGITNAINMSDGMDGLAGGTSLLACCILGYLAFESDDRATALVALCLVASIVGFLRYNTFPARIFMGDTGSQFLGFSVAILGVVLIEQSNRALSPLVPVMILGLPIIDTLQVIIKRIQAGRSPFMPDRRHLHHRLLDLGLNQYEAVVLIYALQILLILMAWNLRYASDTLLLISYLAFVFLLYWLLFFWRTHRTHARRRLRELDYVGRLVNYLRATDILKLAGRGTVLYGLLTLFLVASLGVEKVSVDIGWLALLGAGSLLTGFVVRSIPVDVILRLSAFLLVVVLLYLLDSYGWRGAEKTAGWVYAYLGVMVVGISLWLRFGGSSFRVNSLDVLIILVVLTVPNMPLIEDTGYAELFIQALILFYACELVLSKETDEHGLFRSVVLGSFTILAIRGIEFTVF